LRTLGTPYSDEDIAGAAAATQGKTEMDATIAYLQSLGRYAPKRQQAVAPADATASADPVPSPESQVPAVAEEAGS